MRSISQILSLSALAGASAFLSPGHVTRGAAGLRSLARSTSPRGSLASFQRSHMTRPCVVRMMSDTTEAEAPPTSTGELTELARLEIRVGKIMEVSRHPDADGLYVEKVDVGGGAEGDEGPRTIVSGLVRYCQESELLNREVIVLCNLKPVNMRGVESAGMLLCSSNGDHTEVEPLSPPPGATLGELVTFEGHQQAPIDAGNRAGKAWKRVAGDLKVTEDKVATFAGESLPAPFMTSVGPVTSSLPGTIS
ncbi:unnamed protein product [Discosporangium mesarthrocarpum]